MSLFNNSTKDCTILANMHAQLSLLIHHNTEIILFANFLLCITAFQLPHIYPTPASIWHTRNSTGKRMGQWVQLRSRQQESLLEQEDSSLASFQIPPIPWLFRQQLSPSSQLPNSCPSSPSYPGLLPLPCLLAPTQLLPSKSASFLMGKSLMEVLERNSSFRKKIRGKFFLFLTVR